MQLATERRNPQVTRVPLDDVLINLSPEGYDECFAADGVNVGVGGLSMRSAILPDVGSKLSCRFQSPHDGAAVNADCEVVWSQTQGNNIGEFGLRFTGMTQEDQHSIQELVHAWNEELLEGMLSSPGLDESPNGGTSEIVRLQLDGVGSAIEGSVSHRASDALVVEQPLPFLRVGTGINENGRRGTLQSVDLRVEDDLPRLVLTVWYEDERGAPGPTGNVGDTLQGEAVEFHDGAANVRNPLQEAEAAPSPADRLEVEVEAPELSAREPVAAVRYDADAEVAAMSDSEAESIAAQLKPDLRRSLRAFGARVRPLWGKVRAFAVAVWAFAGPRVKVAAGRTRTFIKLLATRGSTGARALWARATKRSTTPVPTKKRRSQGSRRSTTGRVESQKGPVRSRGIGRVVLGSVVLLALVLFAVSRLTATAPTIKSPETKASAAPLMNPELGDETMVAPEAPIEPAAAPTSAPGEVPAASPYAAESAPTESASSERFESGSLDNARSYTLRMSLPPRGMRGQDTEDGIRVVVLGSNAIDGARRIASADERVQAASILNHGEEAELRLRFTDGDRPGYRIESRGSTLVISIGD